MRFNSSLKVSLNRLILPSGYTAPLSLQKRKKHKLSVHRLGSCYLTFHFGGVTGLLDMISSCCFSQQLPKVSVTHIRFRSTSLRSQVGIRVILLLHAFPSHERMRLLPKFNFVLHSGVVIGQGCFYSFPVARAYFCECTVALGLV